MTKREFLEQLQKTLARELGPAEVADNIRYYSDYIDGEVRSGKSEEQVLSGLGDPRMIARTILDVGGKRAGGASSRQDGTVYTESEDGAYHTEEDSGAYRFQGSYGDDGIYRSFRMYTDEEDARPGGLRMFLSGWKAWLAVAVLLLLLFLLLGGVFVIFWRLLPFLLVGCAAVSVYRWFARR